MGLHRRHAIASAAHRAGEEAACEHEADRLAAGLLAAARRERLLAPGRAHRQTRLSPLLADFFAWALGHDLRAVRLHADDCAAAAVARIGAHGLAHGGDIAFARGRFAPHEDAGFALLAHELVHVVQQGAARPTGERPALATVRGRFAGGAQRSVDPKTIHALVCPPGRTLTRVRSSMAIGTHYGWWLGGIYKLLRDPDPYCLVDHFMYRRGSWSAGFLRTLNQEDPGVALAFINVRRDLAEYGRYRYRADILDAQLDELYEIKPVTEREAGVEQLERYLFQLQRCAPTTGPIHLMSRRRAWSGGTWDPSPYPLMLPGRNGRVCFIHARQDATVQGLLLYEVLCCNKNDIDEEPDLVAVPRVLELVREFRDAPNMQTQIEAILAEQLPLVPEGARYALVVPERVFHAMVMAPRDREWQARYDRIYRPTPSPAMSAFFLQTFVLAYVLAPQAAVAAAMMVGGPIPPETIAKLWKIEIGRVIASALTVAVATVIPAGAGIAAGASATAPEAVGMATELAALESSAAPLTAAEQGVVNAMTEAVADGVYSLPPKLATWSVAETAVMEEAIATTASTPAWVPGMVGSALSERAGLTMVGLLVTAFTSARAEAASVPSPAPEMVIAGSDPLHLVPVEILVPRRGAIALEAEVLFNDEPHFIIGLVGV